MLPSDPLARSAIGVAAAERGGGAVALMEIAGFALRDIIIAIGALAAVYLLYMTIGLLRLRRRKAALAKAPPPMVAPTADPAVAPPVGRYRQYLDEEAGDEDDDGPDLVYARPQTSPPPPAPAVSAPSFGAELERSQLERDVRQLRDEVAALRRELDEMKAASRVSPQYSDAMALVQRGMTAQDVADRCSISLAEAELVWALARNPQDFEEEDDYGGEPGNNPPRRG